MRLWRLTTKRYAETAFSGIGNAKVGSRWVPAGLPAVYTSEHPATAILENLVHMEPVHFSTRYVFITADMPDEASVETVDISDLPSDWRTRYEDPELQSVGETWFRDAQSAFLIVPSAVVPEERNIIINPTHRDFFTLVIHPPQDFEFDRRLHPLPITHRL